MHITVAVKTSQYAALLVTKTVLLKLLQFQDVSTSRTEPDSVPALNGPTSTSATSKPEHIPVQSSTPTQAQLHSQRIKTSSQSQESSKRLSAGAPQALGSPGAQIPKGLTTQNVANLFPNSPQPGRLKAHTIGECKWGQQLCWILFQDKWTVFIFDIKSRSVHYGFSSKTEMSIISSFLDCNPTPLAPSIGK